MKSNQYDKILVISTSAPINPNKPERHRPRYRREFLKCLCYPKDTNIRFTYRKKWIDPDLLKLKPHELSQIPAIILFCDKVTDASSGKEVFRYIPVRFARVRKISSDEFLKHSDDETYLSVSLQLDRFVHWLNNPTQSQEWDAWAQTLKHRPRPLGDPDEKDALFLFSASNFQEIQIDDQEETDNIAWENLVERLSSAETLTDCVFYRFLGIYKDNFSTETKPQKKKRKTIANDYYLERSVYKLHSGNTYSLELRFFVDPGKIGYPTGLIPRTSSQTLKISQPLDASEGITTRTLILINCSTVYKKELITLTVADSNDEKAQSAQAEFLIMIEPQRWQLVSVVLLLAIGALVTGISADMLRAIFQPGNFIHDNATSLEGIVKIIGTIFVGLGAYWGFGKLPT
jgi:hypothetical protein